MNSGGARKSPSRASTRPSAARPKSPAAGPGRDPSAPKTTRPPANERREQEPAVATAERIDRTFDALPDRIDIRDWFYQPRLVPLPDQIVNCDSVDEILDQGAEGACTGFALAAVINYLLGARNLKRKASPRMLYELARRYDEWPGEAYEGSSARGAMKAWVAHGVCTRESWPHDLTGVDHLTPARAQEARGTPGGAFYRVAHREIRDMHSAINEVGILYMTLMVHRGWDEPAPRGGKLLYVENGNLRERDMPVIQRRGRADGGHAVAIVGYTREGFIIQNSWGPSWGADGFALLPYEDYLMHATDVWVAQLGVPVALDLWTTQGAAETTAGLARATDAVPLADIRPYVIDVGNNGRLSDSGQYWTTRSDVETLFGETIPNEAIKRGWDKRRLLLYLHGGLNDERAVAKRIVAFRDKMLANGVYPLHVMWETGAMESLKNILGDVLGFGDGDGRAGALKDWMRKTREGLVEAKDRSLELTLAAPGSLLWDQMKQNAERASERGEPLAVSNVVSSVVKAVMKKAAPADVAKWELHVVAHSAGSIFAAHAMEHLCNLGIPIKSFQMLAPAITVRRFKENILPYIGDGAGKCPHPTSYILSDAGERDDTVGPYGKSLLYLVSNAFEAERDTPLLGMERFLRPIRDKDGNVVNAEHVDPAMQAFFSKTTGPGGKWPSLVIAGAGPVDSAGAEAISPSLSRSQTHGGFDNDEWTLNAVLFRILGEAPPVPFELRDLQY